MGTNTGRHALTSDGPLPVSFTPGSLSVPGPANLRPAYLAHKLPAIIPGNATAIPVKISLPKSTPMVAAAAEAPGCCGIKQCTAYKPVASETDIITTGIPVRLAIERFNPLKTI